MRPDTGIQDQRQRDSWPIVRVTRNALARYGFDRRMDAVGNLPDAHCDGCLSGILDLAALVGRHVTVTLNSGQPLADLVLRLIPGRLRDKEVEQGMRQQVATPTAHRLRRAGGDALPDR